MDAMKRKNSWLFFTLMGLWLVVMAGGAGAAQAQDFVTATPDTEGTIYYEVQVNDNLWTIAFLHGLTLPELLALNNLDQNALIRPGDLLIVGFGEPPATPTVPVPPTPTLPPPTPTFTPAPPPTAICVLAFEDLNANGRFDPGEPLQEAVAFTIFNETDVVANYITDGFSEPHCVEGLPPGNYNVTRSLSSGYQPTTPGDLAITLGWGDRVDLAFGAASQASVAATEAAVFPESVDTPTPLVAEVVEEETAITDTDNRGWGNGRSPWVWWLAACGFMLLAGLLPLGLAIYLYLARGRSDRD
jgi:hypothetical protein